MLLLPWTSRPGGSKCASRDIARKLHLGPPICALRDISQLVASHESTRPHGDTRALLLEVAMRIHTIFAKLNYLALLLSRQSLRVTLLRGSA